MSWRASGIIWMCAIVFIAIGWFLGDADSRTVVDSGPQRTAGRRAAACGGARAPW